MRRTPKSRQLNTGDKPTMSKKLVEKVYGRSCIYEIRFVGGGVLGSDSYQIYKVTPGSEKWIASFKSLADAVAKAKALG